MAGIIGKSTIVHIRIIEERETMEHGPLTEVEENQLRNLLARFRENNPLTLVNLLIQCMFSFKYMDDTKAILIDLVDNDEIPTSTMVIAKGPGPASALTKLVKGAYAKIDHYQEEASE